MSFMMQSDDVRTVEPASFRRGLDLAVKEKIALESAAQNPPNVTNPRTTSGGRADVGRGECLQAEANLAVVHVEQPIAANTTKLSRRHLHERRRLRLLQRQRVSSVVSSAGLQVFTSDWSQAMPLKSPHGIVLSRVDDVDGVRAPVGLRAAADAPYVMLLMKVPDPARRSMREAWRVTGFGKSMLRNSTTK
jgi:hypothetical protein